MLSNCSCNMYCIPKKVILKEFLFSVEDDFIVRQKLNVGCRVAERIKDPFYNQSLNLGYADFTGRIRWFNISLTIVIRSLRCQLRRTPAPVRIWPRVAFFFGQVTVSGEKCRHLLPGHGRYLRVPTKKFAKPKHTCLLT